MLQMQHNYVIIVVIKNQVENSKNMKKLISTVVILSLTMSYALPSIAIEDVNTLSQNNVKIEKK